MRMPEPISNGCWINVPQTTRRLTKFEYLSRAMDVGLRTGQKPITPELVSATLAPDFDDLEPRRTRQGYSVKVLSDQFQSKPIEIKRFLSGQLEPARTRELAGRMRMAGLSL